MTLRDNFLGLPEELSGFDQARVAILPIPFEATTTYGKGTRKGPAAIIEASRQVELYDEELQIEPCQVGIATVPAPSLSKSPEDAVHAIENACSDLLTQGKFVVALGGEHTITVGMVRACKRRFSDLHVLQLDAHSDLRHSYEGSELNHACVMRRVNEICPYVGIGIRSGIDGERALLQPASELVYAHEMRASDNWQERVLQHLNGHVYITIDLDFFDPSIAPSVGTPEPGGFHWYETLNFLRTVVREKKVIGFDVVELSPRKQSPASDFLAAKLIYKLIGSLFAGQTETPGAQEKS